MEKEKILKIIDDWKQKKNIKLYTPFKYFKGLEKKKEILLRLDEMYKNKNEKNIKKVEFKSDKLKKSTKVSKYHLLFEKRFHIPYTSTFQEKSKITGVPLSILEDIYKRGMGAWKTGHRVGASATQWGSARVDSFLVLGCTAFSGDYDLLKKVKSLPKTKKRKIYLEQTPSCPKYKIKKFLG